MTKETSAKMRGKYNETCQTGTKKKGELFLEGRVKGKHCENKNEVYTVFSLRISRTNAFCSYR